MATPDSSARSAGRAARVRHRSVRSIVLQHAAGGALAIVALGAGSVVLLRWTSTDEATRTAQERTRVMATGIVEPALDDDLITGDPEAIDAFDEVTRTRLLPVGAVRIKLWGADGTILYSDERRLVGQRFELDERKIEVLEQGGSEAGISDLAEPENRYEQADAELLEVYQPVTTPGGVSLLFEAYYPYASVTDARDRLLDLYAPIVVGTLAALTIIQVAVAVSLARRLRAEQVDRERLLHRALRASDDERERIARDLHDGVVQDLAGVSFTIAGALDQLGEDVDPRGRAALRDAAAATRRGIRQLRTLLVDLYPPNLRDEGLEPALADLVARAQSQGLETNLEFDPGVHLGTEDEALAFRVAQEAIRNTLKHANASHLDIIVASRGDRVILVVTDDGMGFDPANVPELGHFGLRFLLDAAAARGARLERSSAPGAGTRIVLTLEGAA